MPHKLDSTHKVFVYGTLRRYNTSDMDAPNPEATHVLEGFGMYDAGAFPYITPAQHGVVYGNVIEVNDRTLAALDVYEGVDRGLYTREETVVQALVKQQGRRLAGEPIAVFTYVASVALLPERIGTGDWFNKGD